MLCQTCQRRNGDCRVHVIICWKGREGRKTDLLLSRHCPANSGILNQVHYCKDGDDVKRFINRSALIIFFSGGERWFQPLLWHRGDEPAVFVCLCCCSALLTEMWFKFASALNILRTIRVTWQSCGFWLCSKQSFSEEQTCLKGGSAWNIWLTKFPEEH